MSDFEIARRVILSFLCSLCIINLWGWWLGPERKTKWFRQREKFSFFNMRSVLGRNLLIGRAKTKEGVVVTLAIFASIAIATAIIFYV